MNSAIGFNPKCINTHTLQCSGRKARRKLICFHLKSHWIWFAMHLNRFDHISSPLGITKSTTSHSFNRLPTRSLVLIQRNKIDRWKCYANKRYCTFFRMAASKKPRQFDFFSPLVTLECKVGRISSWIWSVVMENDSWSTRFLHSHVAWRVMLLHLIQTHLYFVQHIELVQNLIYYFPIVFTSKSTYFHCHRHHRLRHKVTTWTPAPGHYISLLGFSDQFDSIRCWYRLT